MWDILPRTERDGDRDIDDERGRGRNGGGGAGWGLVRMGKENLLYGMGETV